MTWPTVVLILGIALIACAMFTVMIIFGPPPPENWHRRDEQ